MRHVWPGCLVLALAGCATGSGIVPIGPDTYTVSELRAPVRGGGAEARRVVLAESEAFCRQQGRVFVPLYLAPAGDPFTPYYPTAFDATFKCLDPGDQAVARFRTSVQSGTP